MCGITGLYLHEGLVCPEQINAMNATLIHRGPDEDGIFVDGRIGLGMRRLSIIDLSGGRQPIANENGTVRVIQNGEIYNFRELRRELEARGHRFATHSDTEALVHAYEEWGGFEFATHLRGMFAVAVWDAGRQELWLVRDRLGIKPLFYAETPAGFAFGSEVKALLASPIVRRELEPRVLAQYFTYGSAALEDSFVKGVRQLRGGRVLRFHGGRSEVREYWRLRLPDSPLRIDEREAAEALRQRLRETVRAHLVADVPVGAFLSGGVDSSAVVGMMAQEGCTNLKTFSIGFGEPKFNELPYAQQVADRWRTEHHTKVVEPTDAIAILDQLLHHLDEPFADASAIPTWYVAQLAASEVKVVLTGDGGDELFAGYTQYAWVLRDLWLERIPRAARRWGVALSGNPAAGISGEVLLEYAAHDTRNRFVRSMDLVAAPLRRLLLRPEVQPERLGTRDPAVELLELMQQAGTTDPLQECMYVDTLHYLPCDILVKVDRMTMAHGLEARPPLLDHEFLEFAASLPLGMKYTRSGRQKHIFKQAVAPLVAAELLDRKKKGFSVPLQSWFAGPLAPLTNDYVLNNSRCGEYLDVRVIRMLFEENRRGRRNHGLTLWAILLLELWLRRVLR